MSSVRNEMHYKCTTAFFHIATCITNKMKFCKSVSLVLLVCGFIMIDLANGHACSSTFFSALVQMIPCRSAVAPFSPLPPNEACCNAIKTLGQPCLCVLVNGPPITGVDRNMALQLPDKCTANFPPCDIIN